MIGEILLLELLTSSARGRFDAAENYDDVIGIRFKCIDDVTVVQSLIHIF